jgi:bis(5'-adenosyl)-triphosphatase
VIPKRVVERFTELTPSEVGDLFLATQTISRVVEREYGGTSLTIAIQDGPDAGQSVSVNNCPVPFDDP